MKTSDSSASSILRQAFVGLARDRGEREAPAEAERPVAGAGVVGERELRAEAGAAGAGGDRHASSSRCRSPGWRRTSRRCRGWRRRLWGEKGRVRTTRLCRFLLLCYRPPQFSNRTSARDLFSLSRADARATHTLARLKRSITTSWRSARSSYAIFLLATETECWLIETPSTTRVLRLPYHFDRLLVKSSPGDNRVRRSMSPGRRRYT